MSGPLIIVKRGWGWRDLLKAAEAPKRKARKLAGSHVADLAELKKAIVLCETCAPRFNGARYGYYRQRKFPYVRGDCDGCRQFSERAALFIHETFVDQCWVEPVRQRMSRR